MHGVRAGRRIARVRARGGNFRARALPLRCFHSNASGEFSAALPALTTDTAPLRPFCDLARMLAPRFLARTRLSQARGAHARLLCAHLGFVVHFGVDISDAAERLHC